jgi:hypothetical protein
MLIDRQQEQMTLFKEMLVRKMTVREAEQIARRIAFEKIRKKDLFITPEVVDMEERLAQTLGTRVHIEPREQGGKISIEYFTHEELLALSLILRQAGEKKTHKGMFERLNGEDLPLKENAKNNPMEIPKDNYTPGVNTVISGENTPFAVNVVAETGTITGHE